MPAMRAKLMLQSVDRREYAEILKFIAVSKDGSYPADGFDEDNSYARWSPSASLEITVANKDLWGKFTPGERYYVDFTKAPPAKAQP